MAGSRKTLLTLGSLKMPLTEAQRELLEDKFVLWEKQSRTGSEEWRDYHRRAAEALKVALAICSEHSSSPLDS